MISIRIDIRLINTVVNEKLNEDPASQWKIFRTHKQIMINEMKINNKLSVVILDYIYK